MDVVRRLSKGAIAGAMLLALYAGPSWAQAQSSAPAQAAPSQSGFRTPNSYRGSYDSYKSDLGPPASTADCPGNKVAHNNAEANAANNFDVPPSNSILSATDAGRPSTGAARTGNYLTGSGVPGLNPFGIGTAKFGPSTGLIVTKRSSASAPDSDTVNAPCGQTAEGTLN